MVCFTIFLFNILVSFNNTTFPLGIFAKSLVNILALTNIFTLLFSLILNIATCK